MRRSWLPDWAERERDAEMRGRGDTGTGGHGDAETRRRGDAENPEVGTQNRTEHSALSAQNPEPGTQNPEPAVEHPVLTPERVTEALKEVYDPELAISIVDLGLVYGVDIEDSRVRVRMTLTSMGCPIGPMLQNMVRVAVKSAFPQVEEVDAELVWNPPWDPYKMASEEAKDMLGIW